MKLKVFTILATAALGSGLAFGQTQDPNKPATDVSKSPAGSPTVGKDKAKTDMKSDAKSDAAKTDINKADVAKTAGKSSLTNRHLALVDMYLNEAIDSAKILSSVSEQQLAKSDAAILNEVKKNLDTEIGKALGHINDLKSVKPENTSAAQTAMPAQDSTARVGELEQGLKDARTAAKKLDLTKAGGAQAMDDVGSHLMAAQNALREIAKQANYTMLSDVKLGTVPVRGTEPGIGHDDVNKPGDLDKSNSDHMKRDLNKSDLNKDINNQDLNKDINRDVNKDLNKGDSKDVNKPGGTTY